MDIKPLVSIIVPVYNADKYLKECIESVLNQTYLNWELILIDDGSRDKSAEICDQFEKMDRRIHCKHIDNAGVSNARNLGIELAQGEYYLFLDADDYFKEDCLEVLVAKATTDDLDIVVFENFEVSNSGSILTTKERFKSEEIKTQSEIEEEFLLTDRIGWEVWGKLYKKDCLEGNSFPLDRKIAEDALFLFKVLLKAKKICFLPYWGYYYRQLDSSAMGREYSDKNFGTIQTVNDIYALTSEKMPESAQKFRLKYYIWFYRNCMKSFSKEGKVKFANEIGEIRKEIIILNITDAKSFLSKKYFGEYFLIKWANPVYGLIIKMVY